MAELYNIYCDESCHLERDRIPVMVLGAVWCRTDRVREISQRVREIKIAHRLLKKDETHREGAKPFESKWSKVSQSKQEFYLALTDYFFDDDDLHFRGIVIDKKILDHSTFGQSHDDWYYKMLFTLLEPIIDPEQRFNIYLDIKDSRSEEKRRKLEEVLRSSQYDGVGTIIQRVQQIRSHESEIMQLADLLIGAIAYANRVGWGDLSELQAEGGGKAEVVERIRRRSRRSLERSTWLREAKFNILRWQPKGERS